METGDYWYKHVLGCRIWKIMNLCRMGILDYATIKVTVFNNADA